MTMALIEAVLHLTGICNTIETSAMIAEDEDTMIQHAVGFVIRLILEPCNEEAYQVARQHNNEASKQSEHCHTLRRYPRHEIDGLTP